MKHAYYIVTCTYVKQLGLEWSLQMFQTFEGIANFGE